MAEMAQKNVSLNEGMDDASSVYSAECRTGANDVLSSMIWPAFGVGKYEALMSRVATSARKRYSRLQY